MGDKAFNYILAGMIMALTLVFPGFGTRSVFASDVLTGEERAWLAVHPEIILAPDPHFLPIEHFDEKGRYEGMAADYISLIQKKLGVSFKIVHMKDWDEILEKTRNREADLWGAATPTPQRLEYMSFTRPFLKLPAVVITRKQVEGTLDLDTLKGMRVSVISGYGIHDHIVNNYTNIELDVVPDIETGLKKVSFGVTDAMVVNIAMATYYIEKEGITNLRVAGESGFIYQWSIASRNDWPVFNQILEKGLAQITPEEKQKIYKKWVSLLAEPWTRARQIFVPILIALAVAGVGGILFGNRSLTRQVRERTLDPEQELSEHKETAAKLVSSNNLLSAISRAQAEYLLSNNPQSVFDNLLKRVLIMTESEYGFIGEVLYDSNNLPYVKTQTLTDISWNEETRALYGKHMFAGLEFKNLKTLFGEVITTGNLIVSNEPSNDPRAGGLPAGHPPLKAFFGLPLYYRGGLIGMVAMANRPGGYDDSLADRLQPFLVTCANLIQAFRNEKHRRQVENDLQEAKEEAEQASRAKSEFLSRMSHELRTPMNAILGFGQLMEMDIERGLPPTHKENVQKILKAGNHLLTLINEVLDLAKIESGKMRIFLENVRVQDVFDEALGLIKPLAGQKGTKLVSERGRGDEVIVRADFTRLKQIVLNLLSNAVKYSSPEASVTIHAEVQTGDRVSIKVTDTGWGIPKDQQELIFLPFHRLEHENEIIEGTGVGLAITKNLAEMMEGTIRVESVPGEGSCFTVVLPAGRLNEGSEGVASSLEETVDEGQTQAQRRTILYVEDQPANLELVRQILFQRPNVKLLSAPDATIGNRVARTHHPDLILMDINLPGMDGLDAFAELRSYDETKSIPVIALSAEAMDANIKKALSKGFHSYITKPIDIPSFLRTIDKVLF